MLVGPRGISDLNDRLGDVNGGNGCRYEHIDKDAVQGSRCLHEECEISQQRTGDKNLSSAPLMSVARDDRRAARSNRREHTKGVHSCTRNEVTRLDEGTCGEERGSGSDRHLTPESDSDYKTSPNGYTRDMGSICHRRRDTCVHVRGEGGGYISDTEDFHPQEHPGGGRGVGHRREFGEAKASRRGVVVVSPPKRPSRTDARSSHDNEHATSPSRLPRNPRHRRIGRISEAAPLVHEARASIRVQGAVGGWGRDWDNGSGIYVDNGGMHGGPTNDDTRYSQTCPYTDLDGCFQGADPGYNGDKHNARVHAAVSTAGDIAHNNRRILWQRKRNSIEPRPMGRLLQREEMLTDRSIGRTVD